MWVKVELVYGKKEEDGTVRPVHRMINMDNVTSIGTGTYKPEEAGSEWTECTEFCLTDGSGFRTKMLWGEVEATIANGEGFPDQAEFADKPKRFPLDVKRKPLPGQSEYIGLEMDGL